MKPRGIIPKLLEGARKRAGASERGIASRLGHRLMEWYPGKRLLMALDRAQGFIVGEAEAGFLKVTPKGAMHLVAPPLYMQSPPTMKFEKPKEVGHHY